MVLPIVVYGDPVLRKVGVDIDKNYEGLDQLIKDMFETMYKAKGVGLAAPQVGKAIRLFIVDTEPFSEVDEEDDEEDAEFTPAQRKELKAFKKVFINARILNEEGVEWKFNEGCLSIPKIREDVSRMPDVEIEYYDEKFVKHVEKHNGVIARVIQHEYDHIDGKLFTDKISPFKRKMISGKLNDIANGKISADYKTKVYKPKR
ncbi:peptide deformylase [Aurantibacillus circumpalustris]|uniref:peptide deformylase n=1 Tax=Aurantibacillus circumpalustris TaxID=3036359 RepID=UPI00295AACFE|nr:peptide deformylase [Aurantibacillus circumpalustris]